MTLCVTNQHQKWLSSLNIHQFWTFCSHPPLKAFLWRCQVQRFWICWGRFEMSHYQVWEDDGARITWTLMLSNWDPAQLTGRKMKHINKASKSIAETSCQKRKVRLWMTSHAVFIILINELTWINTSVTDKLWSLDDSKQDVVSIKRPNQELRVLVQSDLKKKLLLSNKVSSNISFGQNSLSGVFIRRLLNYCCWSGGYFNSKWITLFWLRNLSLFLYASESPAMDLAGPHWTLQWWITIKIEKRIKGAVRILALQCFPSLQGYGKQ